MNSTSDYSRQSSQLGGGGLGGQGELPSRLQSQLPSVFS